MSNFKKKIDQIRINKLKKQAMQAPQPAQRDVMEDVDMNGFVNELEESLQIPIHPTKMNGFVETFSGELSIEMSNGDEIELKYEKSQDGSDNDITLNINNQTFNLNPNFKAQDIANEYKRMLDSQM